MSIEEAVVAGKTQVPAVEGWFTTDPEHPALLGTQCTTCQAIFFPREESFCRNPQCMGREFTERELSRTGTVWSFTDNRYQPPPPYVS
ncbi:MAG: Zn-ribbon domain-containing OB-fold protein, partial [Acidimicrobiales bacterium]